MEGHNRILAHWTTIAKILRRLLSLIASLISFIFFLGILSLVAAFFLVDMIKPATLFNPYVLFPIIVMLLALAAYVTLKGKETKPKRDWLANWSRKKKMVGLILFFSILIIVLLAIRGTSYLNDQRLLEHAQTQFFIETRSEASQGQIENTLIELQRQLTELRSEYVKEPPDYLIKVRMFANVSELHAKTLTPDWADAYVQTAPGQPPIVYLPVEPESRRFDKTAPTPKPAHEITHVVIHEVLRLQSVKLIPTFFRESLAQYESLGGLPNLLRRWDKRVFLLTQEPSLVPRDKPPQFDPTASQRDVGIFYALSYEYARYLADKYGEGRLWQVVQGVGNGIDFNNAFVEVTGEQYLDSYIEFSRHWLFAPVIVKYHELK